MVSIIGSAAISNTLPDLIRMPSTASLAATDAPGPELGAIPAPQGAALQDPAAGPQAEPIPAARTDLPAGSGELTGQAALAVFAKDLRGLGQAAARAPACKTRSSRSGRSAGARA